jgi:hypothetical protein
MHSLRDDINDRISRYLAGQIELSEFHDWFIPATWDVDAESAQVKRLAHRVQLFLAEFSNGDRLEDELRSGFWDILNRSSITVIVGASLPADTTSVTERVGTVREVKSVGTLLAGALG